MHRTAEAPQGWNGRHYDEILNQWGDASYMLKRGSMRIGDANFTVYELRVKGFYRLDIMKKGSAFHIDAGDALFACYKLRNRPLKKAGDERLYQKYKDTVTSLTKMSGQITRESKWDDYIFIMTQRKGEAGNRLVTEFHDGDWHSEMFERGNTSINMRVFDAAFKTTLKPIMLNH